MKTTSIKIAALALLFVGVGGYAIAQQEEPSNPKGDPSETLAPAAPPAKPHAAEIMPRATRSLLLGITNAGAQIVAVGERGNIVISSDGQKWTQSPSPVNSTLTAVGFADSDNGWAVGHDATILHTTDAGKTWTLQHFDPELQKPLLNLLVIDAQYAYALGAYGLFLQTTDGGATWNEVDAPPVRADELHLSSMIRLNTGELFIAGEQGTLAVRGLNGPWTKLESPYEGSYYGALPWGAKGVLVYGQRGNIYLSDDVHGKNWKQIDTGSKQGLFGGTMLKDRGALLVGADEYSVLVKPDATFQVVTAPRAAGATAGGTLSGVIAAPRGLLVVGEAGVKALPLP
ncbi:MAG: hypothetical protein JWQ90_3035 [Hydrocarboniphaga sp.]|uniref:WD40/YVTN/BNR-like repeat-containing protein n=1 Tax=Hydrocarboniphaga sp. TaxID=2033016 RepID=UPI002631A4FC|nr:YCF48-related protein [Hydrocarboniphaga sp.]MDB5970585.1 hypothetical protein [Hydrocarboniphaga sp.]